MPDADLLFIFESASTSSVRGARIIRFVVYSSFKSATDEKSTIQLKPVKGYE